MSGQIYDSEPIPPEDRCPSPRNLVAEDDTYITISSINNHAPEGWTLHTHPRGSIYFRSNRYKAVVDDDLRIPANLEKATNFCTQYSKLLPADHLEAHMTHGVDMSICLFVNHKQCIADYDHLKLDDGVQQDLTVDGLLRCRRLYWNYMMQHPSHHPCHPQGFREAVDALQSYYHDHLIDGSRSIAPFSKAECEQLLEVLHRSRGDGYEVSPSTISLLAWILKDIYSYRTGQRYGQVTWTELRSYRKALYKPPDFAPKDSLATRLFLQIVVNGPFFGIPQTYLAHIKKASEFRGHLAGLRQSWESYALQLVQEYSHFILISTVMLSATVGLLAINDIQPIAQVAAMLSAFASLGSIAVGVFFVWRHQRNTEMPSSFTYLHNARNSAFGLSGHAILLSLPPVLLVWSLIAFTVGTLAYALQDISTVPASAWVVLAIFIVVLVAVVVGLYTFSTIWRWQSQDVWWRSILCWPKEPSA